MATEWRGHRKKITKFWDRMIKKIDGKTILGKTIKNYLY